MTHLYLLRFSLMAAAASMAPSVWCASPQAAGSVSSASSRQVSHSVQPLSDMWQVDEEPTFPGGDMALLRFINDERRYPDEAYRAGISGRVLCSFTIGTDGAVSDIRVVRSVEQSLDREAVRIISRMPRWSPAVHSGEAVPVVYLLPIPFRL